MLSIFMNKENIKLGDKMLTINKERLLIAFLFFLMILQHITFQIVLEGKEYERINALQKVRSYDKMYLEGIKSYIPPKLKEIKSEH